VFNSFELLSGPLDTIQKKYEILSDIVFVEHGCKVHGSQSLHVSNNSMQLIVLRSAFRREKERDEVKRKFNDFVLSIITRTN